MHIPLLRRSGSCVTKEVVGTIRPGKKKKFILESITVIVACVALWVSIRSCQISKDATETSKFHFIQVNRPYLIIAPKKFEDGKFWKLAQINNQVQVILQYEVKNVGNVAAKDISTPDKLVFGPSKILQKGAPVIFRKPGKITLGPGDDFTLTATVLMDHTDEEAAKKDVKHLTSEKSEGVTFLLSVDYTNELDESQKYRTFVENKIHNEQAHIIRSEMFSLNPDISSNK